MRRLGRLLTAAVADADAPGGDVDRLVRMALDHGVHCCLYQLLQPTAGLRALVERLRPRVMNDVAAEMAREKKFLQDLDEGDLLRRFNPVFFKGQALAYSLYPQPWMRPREDIDILIDERDRQAAVAAFESLGYERSLSLDGDLVLPQLTMRQAAGPGPAWDIHWRFSSRPAFAGCLDYAARQEWTVTTRAGSHVIRIPDPPHSLLIACLHLFGHHPGERRLLWLYDMHLLLESLTDAERKVFVRAALRDRQTQSTCHAALAMAGRYLPTPRNAQLCRALDPGPGARRAPNHAHLGRLLDDLRAVRGQNRWRFMKQHALPSAHYMVERFGIRRRWQIPFWYVLRIGRALPKLFRRM